MPVVATPAGEAGSVVQEHSTGYVVQFNNVGTLADQMTVLSRSQELRKSLGENGRKLVEQRSSFEALLPDDLDFLYQNCYQSEDIHTAAISDKNNTTKEKHIRLCFVGRMLGKDAGADLFPGGSQADLFIKEHQLHLNFTIQ